MVPAALDDLYEQLRHQGQYEVTITNMPGYAKVVAALTCEHHLQPLPAKPVMVGFRADVACYREQQTHESLYIPKSKAFPDSKQGVKDAFEYLKESVAYMSRRGFCGACLALERPRKCLRIRGADVCGQCLLKKAIE